jgi:hypothetical protein
VDKPVCHECAVECSKGIQLLKEKLQIVYWDCFKVEDLEGKKGEEVYEVFYVLCNQKTAVALCNECVAVQHWKAGERVFKTAYRPILFN